MATARTEVSLRSDLKAFSGSSQLAGMALESLEPQRMLVAFPREAGLPCVFSDHFPDPTFIYQDYALYRRDLAAAPAARPRLHFAFDPAEAAGADHDLALVYLPKGKELIEHAFATVARLVEPGGVVLVVGPKKSGIRSSKGLVETYLGEIVGARSARHARLHTLRRTVDDPKAFEGERRFRVEAWGQRIQAVTLPGVFSHGRLDAGTRHLLDHLDLPDEERVLDFGCGSGVLGALILSARPDARVELVDSDLMALEASRRTLRANGHDPGGVHASDVLSDASGRYDLILSNPPFHQGLDTDFSATNELIRTAGRHLSPGGRLVLVANTFIDYLTHLHEAFRHVDVLNQHKRYRILQARRPR